MIQEQVHESICNHIDRVEEWFSKKSKNLFFPIYSSFDIRDSSKKVAPVDANLFPAGFNNICQVDKDSSTDIIKSYLKEIYGTSVKKIVLLAEEHTKNAFYWENIYTLVYLLKNAGYSIKVALPKEMETIIVESHLKHSFPVYGAKRLGDNISLEGECPDLIICNNDFSNSYKTWVDGLDCPMNPPHQFGWYARKKSTFFKQYNSLAQEFAQLIHLDPWLFSIKTQTYSHLDISKESSRDDLAQKVEVFLQELKSTTTNPFVFIKNNSGTYGLGIIQAKSGDDIHRLNYKSRKTMKATKGGHGSISEVIIQEGIPSALVSDDQSAEPTLYMIGHQLAGGFLRTHRQKGPEENLNSPGAIYKRLCVTDLQVRPKGHPMENVYGWVARLASLAVANEMKS